MATFASSCENDSFIVGYLPYWIGMVTKCGEGKKRYIGMILNLTPTILNYKAHILTISMCLPI